MVERVCLKCGKKFKVKMCIVKRNGGNYCCKECYYSRIISKETREKISRASKGHKCPEDIKKRFSEERRGALNANWKG